MSNLGLTIIVAAFLGALAHHMWHKRERLLACIPAVLAFVMVYENVPLVRTTLAGLRVALGLGGPALEGLVSPLILLFFAALGIWHMLGHPKKKSGKHHRH